MDLSGAYMSTPILGSNAYVYTDCSGENYIPLSNSNVPDTNPAPYNSDGTRWIDPSTVDREIELFRRYGGRGGSELRNRNPNPAFETPVELDQDADDEAEESNEESEEEVSQEQIRFVRAYLQARSPWITREQLLVKSIFYMNLVWNFLTSAYTVAKKVSSNVYKSFQEETYYFFKDSAHPWDARRVNLSHAGSPHVDWYYNADTRTFSRQENNGQFHHFPYLTAEIYHGDLALYDITSFTESLKWTGGESEPSANHVLSVWSLETGILLDPSLPLVLKVINQEGEESTIPLHTPPAASPAAAST